MKGFIKIVDRHIKRKLLINIDHIEEIIDDGENGTTIYMAFANPHAEGQDYKQTVESYEEVCKKIEEAKW